MHQNNQADPQTYLHRIGRTGRFGRVGVSISLICSKRDFVAMTAISEYFKVEMTGLNTNDWDQIETVVKKIIKSSRADANYSQGEEIQM
jgi:ATP-dependent RNA helicase DDX19/DBP5